MNYSTIKKALVFSVVAALGFSEASAQDATNSSAKIFGGSGQYRTWNLGLNVGALRAHGLIGTNDFNNYETRLGYGLTLRKQLAHSFGLELGVLRGDFEGDNTGDSYVEPGKAGYRFDTKLGYAASLSGVANVATVDFLRRENAVNFIVKAGVGYAAYAPSGVNSSGPFDWEGKAGEPDGTGDNKYVKGVYVPVGVGAKFKVSDRINFDLGYTMSFLDGDNLDGNYEKRPSMDKWSYMYAGLEFSLGSSAKPNLDWVNPVAMMYDELKDPSLRQEVEALKGRVSALESQDLLKDSDGDGVADKLDKCPNTEAGIKVDGSGCPLDSDGDGIPDSKDACPTEKGTAEFNGCPSAVGEGQIMDAIQFEFNSSVLRTSAYPTLDKLSSDLRSNSSSRVQLDGHASAEGTDEYNMQLSRDRANAVKTYLVNSGVAASRISTTAYGERRPVASNATEAGRIKNRRVEFRLQ